jgi:hypothetical protein
MRHHRGGCMSDFAARARRVSGAQIAPNRRNLHVSNRYFAPTFLRNVRLGELFLVNHGINENSNSTRQAIPEQWRLIRSRHVVWQWIAVTGFVIPSAFPRSVVHVAHAPMRQWCTKRRSIDVHQRLSACISVHQSRCGMSVHQWCTKGAPTMHSVRSPP